MCFTGTEIAQVDDTPGQHKNKNEPFGYHLLPKISQLEKLVISWKSDFSLIFQCIRFQKMLLEENRR